MKISTIASTSEHLVVGGVMGQYAYKCLDTEQANLVPDSEGLITLDVNGITNHADIVVSPSASPRAVFSSNDKFVRTLDLTTDSFISGNSFDFAINCTATSPDGKRRLVVGDALETLIIDSQTGKILSSLSGHKDFSFACAWSLDDRLIATGNQDKTCRLYDSRNLSTPLHVVGAQLGAVRSLKFNDSCCYLAMAEPVDYVHILDMKSSDERGQLIEFWGEVAGIGFAGNHMDESLWIGNSDRLVGGLIQMSRNSRTKGMGMGVDDLLL